MTNTAQKEFLATAYPASAIVARREDLVTTRDGSVTTRFMRSYSFLIAWSEIEKAPTRMEIDSPAEYFLLLPDAGATITWSGGEKTAPGRSVCIIPAGRSTVQFKDTGSCVRLFSPIPDSMATIGIYDQGLGGSTPPLRPIKPYRRIKNAGEPAVHVLADMPNSVGMPRAKLFQTETMSINWVEYAGPRDRKNLSPHFHTDIEQASLALEGEFTHHYRTSWVIDADRWRPDEHVLAAPGTIALIPPPIIHTSEGVGATRHILIDVFSPPRADFIAKGQILNAGDYAAPQES